MEEQLSPQYDQPEQPEQHDHPDTWKALWFFVFDFVKVFLIAVAIIVPIRFFLFQPFVVTGQSMEPNFQNGNYLIIDEITYRFREPDRGEVVVMRFPNDESQFFIKRIIALPGERIVVEAGRVLIYNSENQNGIELKENYLPAERITAGSIDLVLGEDEYFVMGDNRLASSDSRLWGPLPRTMVVGRVYIRLLPLQSIKTFLTLPALEMFNH